MYHGPSNYLTMTTVLSSRRLLLAGFIAGQPAEVRNISSLTSSLDRSFFSCPNPPLLPKDVHFVGYSLQLQLMQIVVTLGGERLWTRMTLPVDLIRPSKVGERKVSEREVWKAQAKLVVISINLVVISRMLARSEVGIDVLQLIQQLAVRDGQR
jgi:hypothetical protein